MYLFWHFEKSDCPSTDHWYPLYGWWRCRFHPWGNYHSTVSHFFPKTSPFRFVHASQQIVPDMPSSCSLELLAFADPRCQGANLSTNFGWHMIAHLFFCLNMFKFIWSVEFALVNFSHSDSCLRVFGMHTTVDHCWLIPRQSLDVSNNALGGAMPCKEWCLHSDEMCCHGQNIIFGWHKWGPFSHVTWGITVASFAPHFFRRRVVGDWPPARCITSTAHCWCLLYSHGIELQRWEKTVPGFSRLHIHKLLKINEDDILMSGYMIYWFSMKMNHIKVYFFKPERLRILMIHNDTLMVVQFVTGLKLEVF